MPRLLDVSERQQRLDARGGKEVRVVGLPRAWRLLELEDLLVVAAQEVRLPK